MKYWGAIIIMLVATELCAQLNASPSPRSMVKAPNANVLSYDAPKLYRMSHSLQVFSQTLAMNAQPVIDLPVFCNDDLPFFCRMEVKMEKTFKMPIKFRLGEVQYTENLEGKGLEYRERQRGNDYK